MTLKPADRTDEALDPLRTMVVETVRGPDGRCLIYYSWPEPPPEESPTETDDGGPAADRDV